MNTLPQLSTPRLFHKHIVLKYVLKFRCDLYAYSQMYMLCRAGIRHKLVRLCSFPILSYQWLLQL